MEVRKGKENARLKRTFQECIDILREEGNYDEFCEAYEWPHGTITILELEEPGDTGVSKCIKERMNELVGDFFEFMLG